MLTILEYASEKFDLDAVKKLFREYEAFLAIQLDFQNFDAELASLPGKYAPPAGNLYLGLWDNEPVGCAAFYAMNDSTCELKRMFVKPEAQGKRIGQALLDRAIADAAERGYAHMRLDSLGRLKAARRLYERYGFKEIAPYNENPHEDVYYMELPLGVTVSLSL